METKEKLLKMPFRGELQLLLNQKARLRKTLWCCIIVQVLVICTALSLSVLVSPWFNLLYIIHLVAFLVWYKSYRGHRKVAKALETLTEKSYPGGN